MTFIGILGKKSIKPCLFIIPIGKCPAEIELGLKIYRESFWPEEFLSPFLWVKNFKNLACRIRRVMGAFMIEMFKFCRTNKFQNSLIIFWGLEKIPKFIKLIF